MKIAKEYRIKILGSNNKGEFEELLNETVKKENDVLFDTFRVTENSYTILIGEYLQVKNVKEKKEKPIKQQIREIIKSNPEGLSKEEILNYLLMVSSNEGTTLKDVEKNLSQMFNDGEIYENKPNNIKWLD